MLSFHYLSCGARWLSHLLPGNRKGKQIQTLKLSANALITAQGIIPIEQIRELENNPLHGTIRLLDNQGNALFTIGYFSLLSADLFIALLEHMIYSRIPAYHNRR